MSVPTPDENRDADARDDVQNVTELDGGYAAAQKGYLQGGFHTLPLFDYDAEPPTGITKAKPPGQRTGRGAPDPTVADVKRWKGNTNLRTANTAIRLAPGTIGLDVDAYFSAKLGRRKIGDQTIAELQKRCGVTLPDTWRSSSRFATDPASGIQLFRLPPDLPEGLEWPDKISLTMPDGTVLGDVDLILRWDRYLTSWPSWNPDSGEQYQWKNPEHVIVTPRWVRRRGDHLPNLPEVQLPTVGGAAELPREVIAEICPNYRELVAAGAPVSSPAAEGAFLDAPLIPVATSAWHTEGEPSPRVGKRLNEALAAVQPDSVHNVIRDHVMALMRMGYQNEPGVGMAVAELGNHFVTAAAGGANRKTAKATRTEFRRMITGGEKKLTLQPNRNQPVPPPADVEPPLTDTEVADRALRHAANMRAMSEEIDRLTVVIDAQDAAAETRSAKPDPKENRVALTVITNPEAPPLDPFNVEHLEQDYWTSRLSLTAIYTASMTVLRSPWAVQAVCATRALALVPPTCTLPALGRTQGHLTGGLGGNLNFISVLMGESGAGKGESTNAAEVLVPDHGHFVARNLGSGEGIVAAYLIPAVRAMNGEAARPAGFHESMMFNVAEVDTLAALKNRNGSTTLPNLRKAFSGETLGAYNADPTKQTHLDKGTYRLTANIHAQPARAAVIFEDGDGGTPQRVMWFPVRDRRAKFRTRPHWDGEPLALPDRRAAWLYPRQIRIPQEAADDIGQAADDANEGIRDPLDSHALYCRLKFAYALAVLDGRHAEVTSDDWRLSGIAAAVSAHTRKATADVLEQARRSENITKGVGLGQLRHAARTEEAAEKEQAVQRILEWVCSRIAKRQQEGKPLEKAYEIRKNLASRDKTDKSLFEEALELGRVSRRLAVDEDGYWERLL